MKRKFGTTTKSRRKILVTAALPYANSDIHLGHLVEYLQTDFWVRYQKMRGHECLYFCADDTHGTPIMVAARKRGVSPEELIAQTHTEHARDLADFEISFDNYYTTNSPENRSLCEEFFSAMKSGGHIETRPVQQLYCPKDKIFLPDRFVVGTCPRCGAPGQYGDSCDRCSSTYSPTELQDARCALCGATPIARESEHFFFKLNHFRDFLRGWVKEHTPPEVVKKLEEWLKDDLRDWDISRDAPYFGFEIPGHAGKYFYVWLDAPLGYISSTMEWCARMRRDFREFWHSDDAEIYHFIGKDIVYFHTLFWPAMLRTASYKTPDHVFVHGFLTVNGEKMSKSKGTFINARTYLNHLKPHFLRYYYACKMPSTLDDVELSFDDFVNRVNSELIGKVTNLASRSVQMLNRSGSRLGTLTGPGREILGRFRGLAETVGGHFENRDFSKAMTEVRGMAEQANRYFDEKEPWKLAQADPEAARSVLTDVVNLFRVVAICLKPILPGYVAEVEKILGEAPYDWEALDRTVENQSIGAFIHLAKRIDRETVDAIVQESLQEEKNKMQEEPRDTSEPLLPTIPFSDFAKIDMRIAKVLESEAIPATDKLVRLKIDIGFGTRSIIAGIKQAYDPSTLVGRLIVVVTNLEPRQMKFGTSEGMLLASSKSDAEIFLIAPDSGAIPGQRVH